MEDCDVCNGLGYIVEEYTIAVPVCCGRASGNGECCGDPEPYPEVHQEQIPCPRCYVATPHKTSALMNKENKQC